MHAAVGLAQTRKVPGIKEKNNHNKKFLVNLLSKTEGIGFARLADPAGDSATFLNILMPTPEIAKNTVAELNAAGVGGFNYWFTNMYHFINQWNHLKDLKTVAKLPIEVLGAPQDYNNLNLPKSQEVVGRLISFGVRCTWTEEEMTVLANKISEAAVKAMKTVNA